MKALTAAATSTTTSTPGKLGLSRRATTSSASAPMPNAADAQYAPVKRAAQSPSFGSPSSAGNCEKMMSTAAPWVKAISTGAVTRLSSQPACTAPSAICSVPVSSASHTARLTHSALPGVASPVSEAATSSDDKAVGPTDRRGEAENSAATSAGSIEA